MIVLLLSLFISCHGFCLHRNWSQLLTCYGPQTHKFPIFSKAITHYTQHIDILNTSVTELPNFKEWIKLKTLDIRDNSLLPCTEVFKLQHHYYVTSDCYKLDDHNSNISDCYRLEHINKKTCNHNELYSLFIIPFIILIPGFAAMRYKKYMITPPLEVPHCNHKVENV